MPDVNGQRHDEQQELADRGRARLRRDRRERLGGAGHCAGSVRRRRSHGSRGRLDAGGQQRRRRDQPCRIPGDGSMPAFSRGWTSTATAASASDERPSSRAGGSPPMAAGRCRAIDLADSAVMRRWRASISLDTSHDGVIDANETGGDARPDADADGRASRRRAWHGRWRHRTWAGAWRRHAASTPNGDRPHLPRRVHGRRRRTVRPHGRQSRRLHRSRPSGRFAWPPPWHGRRSSREDRRSRPTMAPPPASPSGQ